MALLLLPTSALLFFQAHIRFKPTLSQQQKSPEQEDTVVDGNFIVRYDVNRTLSGGSIQVPWALGESRATRKSIHLKSLSLGILEGKAK